MDSIADLELLTEGSVWTRTNGQHNIVLCVTNENLPPKAVKSNPRQVVYINEKGDIFNQTVGNFLSTRTFFNVHPVLESRLLALLKNLDEGEETENEETTLLVDDSEEENETVIDPIESIASETPKNPIKFFPMNSVELPTLIQPQRLQELLASYEVVPNLERNWLVHTLAFRIEPDVSANDIFKTFHASNVEHNVLFGFDVTSPAVVNGRDHVAWVYSLGTYPYIVDGDQYTRVMLATNSPVPTEIPEETATTSFADFIPGENTDTPLESSSDFEDASGAPVTLHDANGFATADAVAAVLEKEAQETQAG